MKRHPLICRECGAQQDFKLVRGSWFPCVNCPAHLHFVEYWAQLHGWIGANPSAVALLLLHVQWWISLLFWFPVSVLLGVVSMTVSAFYAAPKLESDLPGGPRPGSQLGL